MTNEVEELILNDITESVLNISEKNAYLLYKELWKFIIFASKYDYNKLSIRFNVIKRNNCNYLNKQFGIRYELDGNDFIGNWKSFYDDCDRESIIKVLNTNIDIRLLFRLLSEDEFFYDYLDDEDMLVYIETDKYKLNKKVESVLLKNKILKRNEGI